MKKGSIPASGVLFALVIALSSINAGRPAAQSTPSTMGTLGDLMAWADADGSGLLDPREIDIVAIAALDLFSGPHAVRTVLDGVFDANGDGFIDIEELTGARGFFGQQLMLLQKENPELAAQLDVDDDGVITDADAQRVAEYLFIDPLARIPHEAKSPIDRRADLNRDGTVSLDELFDIRMELVLAVALIQYPPGMRPLTSEILKGRGMETSAAAAPEAAAAALPQADSMQSTQVASQGKDIALTAEIDQIFPVFHKYYDDHPIGKAILKNKGKGTIEGIQVQLIVKGYMTEKKPCTGLDRLEPGAQKEVELYALFTKDVLEISEPTKALANISVEYTAGGQAWTQEFVQTVSFLNRNNMTWDDDNRVAAFVTANDRSIMMFRSAVVTIVDQASAAVDAKLRTAIAIHEALRLYGMKYWSDPKSSFVDAYKKKTDVDYLQFPEQTLQLRTGDCDDLSILYAALLEASSVDTAFITVPGHIFIAFELLMPPEKAKTAFFKWEDLIITKGKAWVPLEVTSIKESFLKAWETGAKEWRDASSRGQAILFTFEDARKKYAPVGFSTTAPAMSLPSESALASAYKAEVKKFIDREIATAVAVLKAEINKNGGKPESVNRLGALYASYGLFNEAENEFLGILKKTEYVPTLVNLGNIAFLRGNAQKAAEYYERAQKKDPDRPLVLLGLARAHHELENYGKVQTAYSRLKTVDPSLASDYTYLELRGTEATRAASISEVTQRVEWDGR
jgi:hypothetical protein